MAISDSQNPSTAKRFHRTSAFIGYLEVIAAVLAGLSGYSIGQGQTYWAIIIGSLYVGVNAYVTRCVPIDPITTIMSSSPAPDKPDTTSSTTSENPS